MKQNLRLRDNHALLATNHKRNFKESCVWTHAKAPARSGLGLALGMLLLCLFAFHTGLYAQPNANQVTESERITSLQIGDTIPDALWNMPLQVVNHPDGRDVITLSDYRNKKLIILDFWATWCGSCIAAMPSLHALQNQFRDDMIVVPVTYEVGEKAKSFLESNGTVKDLKLSSVVSDSCLSALFPHNSVPHYIWIDSHHTVAATTAAHQVTAANIEKAISGENTALVNKLTLDNERPLLLSDSLLDTELLRYSILLKGQHLGLPAKNITRQKEGIVYGRAGTNLQLLTIYRSLAHRLFKSSGERLSRNRILIESDSPTSLAYELSDANLPKDMWDKENLYSFDVIVPTAMASRLDSLLLELLNNSSGYSTGIEYREMACFVLRKIGDDSARPADGYSTLASDLGRHPLVGNLPVIDESGFDGNNLPRMEHLTDLAAINKRLRDHGLEFVKTERRLAMFVIRDN